MSGERTTYHHGDLRRALLSASLAVLAEVGADGFTLREVARRAGVNHRAVYRHFEDKRALLAAIAEEGYRALASEIEAALLELPEARIEERLVKLCERYVRFARNEPSRYQVMFGPRLNVDERFPDLEAAIRLALAPLLRELERAAPGASTTARRDAGIGLWSSVHGLSSLVLVGRVPVKEKHLSRYVDALFRPMVHGIVRALRG